MDEWVIRYLHFIGIIALTACLVAEHLLIAPQLSGNKLKKIVKIDSLYGASAVLILMSGLLLWLYTGKPAEFYSTNPVFHTKLGLFILVGLISIAPTWFFIRNRNTDKPVQTPKYILIIIRTELTLLLVIPLFAVLMAKGIGLSA